MVLFNRCNRVARRAFEAHWAPQCLLTQGSERLDLLRLHGSALRYESATSSVLPLVGRQAAPYARCGTRGRVAQREELLNAREASLAAAAAHASSQ
eukprot:5630213-Pleurochrysis_carterae.AAC.1